MKNKIIQAAKKLIKDKQITRKYLRGEVTQKNYKTKEEGTFMPCGSNHTCHDCSNFYYMNKCDHLRKMNDEEYQEFLKSLGSLNIDVNKTKM